MPGTPCAAPSGDACDHFHRYPDDIATIAELGFGAYRFSVEWSRIEPEDGEFSTAALDHYRRMCEACRAHGLLPVVTFHHSTNPRWLSALGGWADPIAADRFARFCEQTATHLGDLMGRACTINEPNIVATIGYLEGTFPPGEQDPGRREAANDVLIRAHRGAVDAIRSSARGVPVGMTLAMSEWTPVDGAESVVDRLRAPMEDVFLEAVGGNDFIWVQTYTRNRVGPDGHLGPEHGAPTTPMGYEVRPQALEATVRRAWDVAGIPVLVTENGIAADDDVQRVAYVDQALDSVLRCLDDHIPVDGYFYWSALDNFEWALGYEPTFGLIAVDRSTQTRTVKSSARWLGDIARRNGR